MEHICCRPFRLAVPQWFHHGSVSTSRSSVGSRAGAPVWPEGSRPTPRLQPPPRRTQRADFPHCAPPFASRQSLWDLSYWGDFRPVASHSIGVEQPSSVVQPPPIPSFPVEAAFALTYILRPQLNFGQFSKLPMREMPQIWGYADFLTVPDAPRTVRNFRSCPKYRRK